MKREKESERWIQREGFIAALLIGVGWEFRKKIEWTWNSKRDSIGHGDKDA